MKTWEQAIPKVHVSFMWPGNEVMLSLVHPKSSLVPRPFLSHM